MMVGDVGLGEWEYGAWGGMALRDVPDLARFVGDASFVPPGGESAAGFQARVGRWLEGCSESGVVLVSAAVVRGLVIAALGGDAGMALRLDVRPWSRSELTFYRGWRVSVVSAPV